MLNSCMNPPSHPYPPKKKKKPHQKQTNSNKKSQKNFSLDIPTYPISPISLSLPLPVYLSMCMIFGVLVLNDVCSYIYACVRE